MDVVVAVAIVLVVLVAAFLGRLLYLRWRVESIPPTVAAERLEGEGSVVVLDVRQPDEYEAGHIRESILAPAGTLDADTRAVLGLADQVVVVCARGNRSLSAAYTLIGHGYDNVVNLSGGMKAWKRSGLPVDHGQPQRRQRR